MRKTSILRKLLDRDKIIVVPGVLAGFPEYQELEEEYLPKDALEARYDKETPGLI